MLSKYFKISEFELLKNEMMASESSEKKHEILDSIPEIGQFLNQALVLEALFKRLTDDEQLLIKIVLAIGQGPLIFHDMDKSKTYQDEFFKLVSYLKELETFYEPIGGILGYHLEALKLINAKNIPSQEDECNKVNYYEPEGFDLLSNIDTAHHFVHWGLENMHLLAEIYPLGGAGDRLNLLHEKTGEPLPAAQLLFCGRTLFEGMIRDLEGREFLYYKLYGKQITTPLAIMTSHEKNNHQNILRICENCRWFGRDKSNFFFFNQILVPLITEDGFWAVNGPLHPILKPGGHGVIWKIALDNGLFDWLEKRGRSKAIVRQINNPAAGIDIGLLALSGIGCYKKKKFGFASCPRLLNMPEGMDVLCEKKSPDKYEYCITNIEYTEFKCRNIQDTPKDPNSPYSQFPANTNILFVDLHAIKPLIRSHPIPGMLMNMKTQVTCLSPNGEKVQKHAGRIESTMQNIADYIVDIFPTPLEQGQRNNLSTFLTYNERKKTISVTKKALAEGEPILGTPEGCHFEMMQNYHDLLSNYCHFQLPPSNDEKTYLTSGPSVLVDFHPALGCLYHVVSQKLRGGRIERGSEWIMDISEVDIANLNLAGSLLIEAKSIMGKKGADGILLYDSAACGKCTLKNVSVKNRGIKHSAKNIFWNHSIAREECLKIILHGNGEFFAENVLFSGNFCFEVPNGHRMHVEQKNNQISWRTEKIDGPTWHWQYAFDKTKKIVLDKVGF